MKLKYYMRGMGVGIVVTSLIFLIAIAFLKPLNNNDGNSATILEEQEKKDDKTAKEDKKSEEESDSNKVTTVDEDGNVTTVETIPGAEEDEADAQAAAAEAQAEADAQKAKAEQKAKEAEKTEEKKSEDSAANTAYNGETFSITINGGESSNTVGNKLQQAGAVDSGSRFNKYLEDNNYDNVIRPGTYTVPAGSTYEEIANIITGR